MKHQCLTLVTILLCIDIGNASSLNAPNLTSEQKVTRTIICGRIPYLKGSETIRVEVWDDTDLLTTNKMFSTQTKNGDFKIVTSLKNPCQITLFVGSNRLYGDDDLGSAAELILLEPGDSLSITIPDQESRISKGVIFSGRGSQKQTILNSVSDRLRKLKADWPVKFVFNQKEIIEFNIAFKQVIEEELKRYRRVVSSQAYNELRAILLAFVHISSIQALENDNTPNSMARTIYSEQFISNFPIEDIVIPPDRVVSGWVIEKRALLDEAIRKGEAYNSSDARNFSMMYELLISKYSGKTFLNRIIAGYIVTQAKRYGWNEDLEKVVNLFKASTSNDPYSQQIGKLQDQFKALAKDARSLDFYLKDSTDSPVSLGKFRGKVILLDFMFTGCEGCLQMAPVLDDLHRKYSDQDVIFISISVDKSFQHFKQGIGRFSSSSSIPFYTSGEGTSHMIVKYFALSRYPTLVLIGRNGNLISSRAPDPRNEQSRHDLESLINIAIK